MFAAKGVSEMTNLYPCRYCGGKAKLSGKRAGNYRREGTLYYVMCNSCRCRGPQFKGKDGNYENGAYVGGKDLARTQALDAWNLLMSSEV